MSERLRVQLVRSMIGYRESQRVTVRNLGLRKIRQTVELPNTPEVRGMIFKVQHMVKVEEL